LVKGGVGVVGCGGLEVVVGCWGGVVRPFGKELQGGSFPR